MVIGLVSFPLSLSVSHYLSLSLCSLLIEFSWFLFPLSSFHHYDILLTTIKLTNQSKLYMNSFIQCNSNTQFYVCYY